jgi:preprotein translocase subunit SecA
VTVNDYLVERDAAGLRPLYTVCGVTVAGVTAAMEPAARLKGYACDVTYTTSKELLADFLRDRLRLGGIQNPTQRLIRRLLAPSANDGLLMRGLHTAIVDEADSLLIDEAVTPLIISAPTKNELLKEAGQLAEQIVGGLELEADYWTNSRYKEIELTDAGRDKLAGRAAQLPGLWRYCPMVCSRKISPWCRCRPPLPPMRWWRGTAARSAWS